MPIDDSALANALRPVVVGRKNDLHLGATGGKAAVLMSLVQSDEAPGNSP
jgi:transposase